MPTIWNFTMSLSVKTVNKCRPLNLGNTTYRMNKTLRVLQLGKFYPIMGGVEKVMYDLMSGLSERGVPCDMLCALSQGSSRTFSINAHSPADRLPYLDESCRNDDFSRYDFLITEKVQGL